mgnify:CR=1 FL=1
MRQCAVISRHPVECLDRRHVDAVGRYVVISARLLGHVDLRARRGEECLQGGISLGTKITRRIGQDVELPGQAFDLIGIEDTIGLGVGEGRCRSGV